MVHTPSRRTFLRVAGASAGATTLVILPRQAAHADEVDNDGSAAGVVRAMFASLAAGDADKAASFFSADAVLTNVPLPPPIVGRDAIRAAFRLNATLVDSVSIDIRRLVTRRGLVMTERIDNWRYRSDGERIHLPVMGRFTVSTHLITTWSDYFDLAQSGLATHLPSG